MDGARQHAETDPINKRDRLRAGRRIVWWEDCGDRLRVYQGQYGDQGKSRAPSKEQGQLRCVLTTGVAERHAFTDRPLTRINTAWERRRYARCLAMRQQADKRRDYDQSRQK